MRTDQKIYKAIADIVNLSAPNGWQKIIVNASIADDNGETIYDYLDESGKQKWFAPEPRKQYEVYAAFQELRTLMKASGHSWDAALFTLERTGEFRIEFDCKK